jgi:hypothetical protein
METEDFGSYLWISPPVHSWNAKVRENRMSKKGGRNGVRPPLGLSLSVVSFGQSDFGCGRTSARREPPGRTTSSVGPRPLQGGGGRRGSQGREDGGLMTEDGRPELSLRTLHSLSPFRLCGEAATDHRLPLFGIPAERKPRLSLRQARSLS